jgi:O-antigen/teichoic acid export membrane protein
MTALQAVGIAMRTVASAGGVLVLRLAAPTLTAFLLWQMAVSVAHALALAVLLRRSLPAATRSSRFDVAALRSIRRFAAGMSGIAVSGLLLAQADKIVLSRLLDLRSFGYYSLAATVGAGLYVLILPVFGVLFPALSACVAAGDEAGERRVYHLATQTLAASVVPLAAVVAFFAYDVLLLWTGNDEIARCGAPVVQLLLAGTAINGLMNPAYALQLAHGWTRIGLVTNLCLLAGLLPALAWVAPRHGVTGAAALWMGLNAVYMAVGIWRTHRRLLRGAGRVWLLRDVLPPAAGGVLTAAAGWALVRRHGPLSPAPLAVAILAVLVSAWLAAVLAAPRLREWASPQRRPPRGAPGRRDAERRA